LGVSAKWKSKESFVRTGKSGLMTFILFFDETNVSARGINQFTEEQEKKWDETYVKLCTFKKLHGHCEVSYYDENNQTLAKWVSVQRVTFGKGCMNETRKQ
jgi:hypothetical protein